MPLTLTAAELDAEPEKLRPKVPTAGVNTEVALAPDVAELGRALDAIRSARSRLIGTALQTVGVRRSGINANRYFIFIFAILFPVCATDGASPRHPVMVNVG